jgi:hypothetical protein
LDILGKGCLITNISQSYKINNSKSGSSLTSVDTRI